MKKIYLKNNNKNLKPSRIIFETEAMDRLSKALDKLLSSRSNILEVGFDCTVESVIYTFTIKVGCPMDNYSDKFEIFLI